MGQKNVFSKKEYEYHVWKNEQLLSKMCNI